MSTAFNNWEEWARTDWREFCLFFINEYGAPAFQLAEREFAKQLNVGTHIFQQITNIAIGKGIEYGVSATLGSILTFSDFFSKIGGFVFYKGARAKDYSRWNPHTLVKTSVWNDNYTFHEGHLAEYVQFILYCYPKDLQEGWGGFRYGAKQQGGGTNYGRLRKLK